MATPRQAHEERCATILTLLDHWKDFYCEPAQSAAGFASDDPGRVVDLREWTVFSSMGRHETVRELARCLGLRQRLSPNHYRHLVAFTVYAEWRLVDKPTKRRDHRGRMVDAVERSRERLVPRWVAPRMVDLCLCGIVFDWQRTVPLRLPPALTRRLGEFTDQHGTHVTERAA